MKSKIVFVVGEDLPLIWAGRIDDFGEIVATQDITQPVLECAVEYLLLHQAEFTHKYNDALFRLQAIKIEPDGQAG